MTDPFEIHWAQDARHTFEQLPQEVQDAFTRQVPGLVAGYAQLYAQRPEDTQVVGNISHLQAPDWNLWLRMDTEYAEKDGQPILFINEFSKLSPTEFEQSVMTNRAKQDGRQPRP
ncbi:hypothetical protein [Larkinella rosea]|uniref:Uncharacterized protein n=1 Tax=Larkinella rosea TaxID=2025312 RepID=A0A3P1BTT1_9BACT|nr:hypothetical protein [Larkinella rosea]RRB03934.1 hypothetical protein EHT25_10395 [Larkinella rosea]